LLRRPPVATHFPYTTLFRSRMFHAIAAEHLLHQQFGVGDDLDLRRSFRLRGGKCFEQSRIFGDVVRGGAEEAGDLDDVAMLGGQDRKSTRLNSSHRTISYAV